MALKLRGANSNLISRLIVSGLTALVLAVQPLSVFAGPIINEVMPNPVGISDADGEWVELKNDDATAVDISGWTVADATVPGGESIAANGLFVLCKTAEATTECDAVSTTGMSLANTGERTITLKDASSNPVDEFTYNKPSDSGVAEGESLEVVKENGEKKAVNNSTDTYATNQSPSNSDNTGTPGAKNRAQATTVTVGTGGDYATLQEGINNVANGGTVTLVSDLTVSAQVNVTKSVKIKGDNYTITASAPISGGVIEEKNINNVTISELVVDGDGQYVHGIKAFKGTVALNDVTLKNTGKHGLLVNSANVTVDNLTTLDNAWGGVDVAQNDNSSTTPAVLTINGTSTHTETYADVAIGDTTKNVTVNDTKDQYNQIDAGSARYYKLKPIAAQPAETEVVRPGQMGTWGEGSDKGNGGTATFMEGPATPPLGGGSVELKPADSGSAYMLATSDFNNTMLRNMAELSYDTYRSSGGAAQAIALQFNIDMDSEDSDAGWQGRLVYEPYLSGATVNSGEWQSWNPMDGNGGWYFTGTTPGGVCKSDSYADTCSWQQVLANFPNANITSATILKVGSGWTNFAGNVDKLHIASTTKNTTYNFEPAAAPNTSGPDVTKVTPTGIVKRGKITIEATVSDRDGDAVKSVAVNLKNANNLKNSYQLTQSNDDPAIWLVEVDATEFVKKGQTEKFALYMTAVDERGKSKSSVPGYITIDGSGPSISDKTPAEGATIGGTSYEVSATVKDISGVKDSSVYARFRDDTGKEYTYYMQRQGDSDVYSTTVDTTKIGNGNTGPNRVSFRAVDSLGNPRSSVSENVSIDNARPEVNVITPEKGATIKGTKRFIVEVTDQSGVQKVAMYLRNQEGSNKEYALTKGDNNQWYEDVDTANDLAGDGTYQLVVRAVAADGANKVKHFNNRENSYDFVVDNTAPTIKVKDNYVGDKNAKIYSQVSFKLYDAYKIDKYSINEHMIDLGDSKWSDANFQNFKKYLNEGAGNSFVLYDVSGNESTYTFTYDSTSPAQVDGITIKQDGQDLGCYPAVNSRSLVVDWNSIADAYKYEYQADADMSSPYEFTTDVRASQRPGTIRDQDDTYNYRVRAIDQAGNKGEWSIWCGVTLDRQAPDLKINEPTKNADGTWTVTGTNNEPYEVVVSLDGSEVGRVQPSANGDWTFKTSAAPGEGKHTFTAKSTDGAGNESEEASSEFTVTPQTSNEDKNKPRGDRPTEVNPELVATTDLVPVNNIAQPGFAVSPFGTAATGVGTGTGNETEADDNDANRLNGTLEQDGADDDGDVLAATADKKDKGAAELLGIAWYWWLVALGVAAGLWWLLAARRRRAE